MNAALRESLYDLYEQGGLELMMEGTRGLKRELVLNLEMSGLDASYHEIIRYHAVNRWDENDEFCEYARPRHPLSELTEEITGITNERLSHCRPSSVVLDEFLAFIDGAELIAHNLKFDEGFLGG